MRNASGICALRRIAWNVLVSRITDVAPTSANIRKCQNRTSPGTQLNLLLPFRDKYPFTGIGVVVNHSPLTDSDCGFWICRFHD
jgi:hypothetical protein